MKEMDFEKLRDLITKCKTANYQAGLDEGRAEVAKEISKNFDAELEWYLQECEAESRKPIVERKNIVVQGESLPPQPPTERRCRNCWHFLSPLPYGRETAKAGKCMARNVGPEFANAMNDLDHSWCTLWEPAEEEQKKTEKPSLTALVEETNKLSLAEQMENAVPAEAPSDEEEDDADGDNRCGDCLYFDRRKSWCNGHDMPAIPDGNACPDFRARRSSAKCGDCAKYASCSADMVTDGLELTSACGQFELKERT